MSRFDSGYFLLAMKVAWKELIRNEKVRIALAERKQKGVVVRVVDRRANTIAHGHVGLTPGTERFELHERSYAAAARLLASPTLTLTFDVRAPIIERDSAALRLGTHIVACAGVWSELGSLLLLKTAVDTKRMTRARARELTLLFPGSAKGIVPDELWFD